MAANKSGEQLIHWPQTAPGIAAQAACVQAGSICNLSIANAVYYALNIPLNLPLSQALLQASKPCHAAGYDQSSCSTTNSKMRE